MAQRHGPNINGGVSVSGGAGADTFDASQMLVPVTLYYNNNSQSQYKGGLTGGDTLLYLANPGTTNVTFQPSASSAPTLNGDALNVNRIETFQVQAATANAPVTVNNSQQLIWPFDPDLLTLTTPVVESVGPSSSSLVTSLVADFLDADPDAISYDTATIDWGDGSTTTVDGTASAAGQIVGGGGNTLAIHANHLYATDGTWAITVYVVDSAGAEVTFSPINYTGGLQWEPNGELSNVSGSGVSRSTRTSNPPWCGLLTPRFSRCTITGPSTSSTDRTTRKSTAM